METEEKIYTDTMDDPTDVVAAIEEFTNISKDDAVSALDALLMKKMMYQLYLTVMA